MNYPVEHNLTLGVSNDDGWTLHAKNSSVYVTNIGNIKVFKLVQIGSEEYDELTLKQTDDLVTGLMDINHVYWLTDKTLVGEKLDQFYFAYRDVDEISNFEEELKKGCIYISNIDYSEFGDREMLKRRFYEDAGEMLDDHLSRLPRDFESYATYIDRQRKELDHLINKYVGLFNFHGYSSNFNIPLEDLKKERHKLQNSYNESISSKGDAFTKQELERYYLRILGDPKGKTARRMAGDLLKEVDRFRSPQEDGLY